jgi:hypothetical protein
MQTKHDSSSETMLLTYHVKPGQEAAFEKVLSQAWDVYQDGKLVFAKPHIIVRGEDGSNKTRFVEIFTWKSRATPENAPDSVSKIWDQMQSLCETRDGHKGIEGGEVEIVAPKH